jgi:hypothetical protein
MITFWLWWWYCDIYGGSSGFSSAFSVRTGSLDDHPGKQYNYEGGMERP